MSSNSKTKCAVNFVNKADKLTIINIRKHPKIKKDNTHANCTWDTNTIKLMIFYI